MKKRIFILVNKYPNEIEPNVCVFIQQLVWSFADLEYDCNVICPMPINFNIKYLNFLPISKEKNENGKEIKIYHPKYISMGQGGTFLQKIRVKFTTWQYMRAVDKILKRQHLNNKKDIIYSHFICPSGVTAAKLGKKYNIKSFMAHGEAIYTGNLKYGNDYLKKTFLSLDGAIAVSTQNKDFLLKSGVLPNEKIKVFPNGYREERFYKMDRREARKYFGWDEKKFIIGICGSFDETKGIMRLQEAIDGIEDKDILFAAAGKGRLVPTSKKCIWKKPINNKELVFFYNAIDVFCLPTQNEGCCNAIVEAIACGCPIISSDRLFNYDILDKNNAILINPDNVEEIKQSIIELKNDRQMRKTMEKHSIKKAKDLTLRKRAENILEYMNTFFE